MRLFHSIVPVGLILILVSIASGQSGGISPLAGNVDRPISAWAADAAEGANGEADPGDNDESDPDADLPPVLPPPTFFNEDLLGHKIVFCLDRSCSMSLAYNAPAPVFNSGGSIIATPNRWQVTQWETVNAIGAFQEEDEFDVIIYNHAFYAIFGALVPGTAGNKAAAISAIWATPISGGTWHGPALTMAFFNYSSELDMVVFLSDGYVSSSAQSIAASGVAYQQKPNFKFLVLQIGGQPMPPMVALGSLPHSQFVLK